MCNTSSNSCKVPSLITSLSFLTKVFGSLRILATVVGSTSSSSQQDCNNEMKANEGTSTSTKSFSTESAMRHLTSIAVEVASLTGEVTIT